MSGSGGARRGLSANVARLHWGLGRLLPGLRCGMRGGAGHLTERTALWLLLCSPFGRSLDAARNINRLSSTVLIQHWRRALRV